MRRAKSVEGNICFICGRQKGFGFPVTFKGAVMSRGGCVQCSTTTSRKHFLATKRFKAPVLDYEIRFVIVASIRLLEGEGLFN